MAYCDHCVQHIAGLRLRGYLCCNQCGKVLKDWFSQEPTFVKNAAAQEQAAKEAAAAAAKKKAFEAIFSKKSCA